MALRVAGKKGLCACLSKVLPKASKDALAATSALLLDENLFSLSASARQIKGYSLCVSDDGGFLTNKLQWRRCFHSSQVALFERGREDDDRGLKNQRKGEREDDDRGLKNQRKGKYKKKPMRTTPPVEAPYVPPKRQQVVKHHVVKTIEIFEGMTILELAKRCGESIATVQAVLLNVGEKISSEFDSLTMDVAELIAMEIGVNVKRLHSNEGANILPRPPVITVMGHVDHGKTSLLDALRQTSVADKEAGGITQHLGAFVVGMQSGASITFLDTPGHAAFSSMRARGAAVTDIIVLVVAADDGLMPQTVEAMSHAKAAGVPIVVALNKCDKPTANPERVRTQLVNEGLQLEDIGGDVQVVEVSAVTKSGLDKLEEALLLQAELMELKARVDGPAHAYVVEARLDKGRGPLATAIVRAGTLVCGQYVVVGAEWGRIRAIRDMMGKPAGQATPAMPVVIEGLKGLPEAGDDVTVVHSEERARLLSEGRKKKRELDRLLKLETARLEVLKLQKEEEVVPEEEDVKKNKKVGKYGRKTRREQVKENIPKSPELPLIVKADVQGTAEAVADALKSLNSPQLPVFVVHTGVGPITQSDVDLAQACNACIVGFNVREPPISITQEATRTGVKIKVHRVIYHLLEDIGKLIVEEAPGTYETRVAGEAQVLNIFELKGRTKVKGSDAQIAGCRVLEGRMSKSSPMKVLRSGEVVFEGSCASLKREKNDVDAVGKGNECGLIIGGYFDFQIGDVIQCLEQVNIKPKFVSAENGAVRIEE